MRYSRSARRFNAIAGAFAKSVLCRRRYFAGSCGGAPYLFKEGKVRVIQVENTLE